MSNSDGLKLFSYIMPEYSNGDFALSVFVSENDISTIFKNRQDVNNEHEGKRNHYLIFDYVTSIW